ncbi:putative adhesin [Sphingomonas sp.]|uniref:putative adhesin n=1 Tax=Sphingomonas sp. TaxID=28214 RepID=UPI003B3A8A50
MPRLLVNSHGGRDASINPDTFVVPAGVTVHFYCNDGDILSNDDSWRILNHRRQQTMGDPVGTQSFGPTSVIPNYYALPYDTLGVNSGLDREEGGRRGKTVFTTILSSISSQDWGTPTYGTVIPQRYLLPSINGGPAYMRSAIMLRDIANCPGVTDVDWIACREHW